MHKTSHDNPPWFILVLSGFFVKGKIKKAERKLFVLQYFFAVPGN